MRPPGSIQPRRLTAFLYIRLLNAVVWSQSVPVCCIVIASLSLARLPISTNKTADCVYKELRVRDLSFFFLLGNGLVITQKVYLPYQRVFVLFFENFREFK